MEPAGQPTKTILLVEDNAALRERLAAVLAGAGYAVTGAVNGKEALDYLGREPPPDLIVLDMLMPVLDGWHFLGALRRLALPRPVPVLVATGTNLTREWAADHGCAGFLRKPVEADALLAEVRDCLAGRGA